MKNRIVIALAFCTLALSAAAQQLPPGKWWQRPEVVRQLELTTQQQDRLDAIFLAAANDLIDAKADVEKLQIALRGEIDRPELNRQEIQKIAQNLNDARGKLFARELMMLVDMRGVLNVQQWEKLRNQLDNMRERRQGQRQMPPRPPRQ
jgi:Spy/CpxP family protein refolding chaperone